MRAVPSCGRASRRKEQAPKWRGRNSKKKMHNRGVESGKKFITSPTERREMTLTRSAHRKTRAENMVETYVSESDIRKQQGQKARACPVEKSRRLGSHSSEMKNSQASCCWQGSACELTGSSRAMEKKKLKRTVKKNKKTLNPF